MEDQNHAHKGHTCPICHKTFDKKLKSISCCEKCKNCLTSSSTSYQDTKLEPIMTQNALEEAAVAIAVTQPSSGCCSAKNKNRKGMIKYYKTLNNWIDLMSDLNESANQSDDDIINSEDKASANFKVRCATYTSFFVNFCLLCGKAFALSTATSYSLISSLADSALDLIAGIIIACSAANSKFTREDLGKYPVGKSRVSTVGILVFSVLMSCCAAYIIIQCVLSLIKKEDAAKATTPAVIIMLVTIGVKLAMFIIYRCIGHPYTITLSEDHRNDVLTNLLGLFMYWGGSKLGWWMDPTGGILLSLFVLISWVINATENAKMLMGASAPPEIIRSLTYVAAHHHPLIIGVEQVIAFQVGPEYFAELHIVVPGHIPLEVAHWIGESLQLKVERLPQIERCWVHVDCETHNENEHILSMRACGKVGKSKSTDSSETSTNDSPTTEVLP